MTTEPLKGNNRRIIALAEERLKEKIVEELWKERRTHGQLYMWLAEERALCREDLDGTFEKQKIIGYNTALIDIIKNITTKR